MNFQKLGNNIIIKRQQIWSWTAARFRPSGGVSIQRPIELPRTRRGVNVGLFMAVLWNRAGHYICALWFLSFFFLFSSFYRLISAVADTSTQ